MIKVEIITDSINIYDCRMTTVVAEFPRWILAEINTHRMISRNVASSRAIPIKKMLGMVQDNPAIPSFWGANQSGMQSHTELFGEDLERAKNAWKSASLRAIESAKELEECGLHKQYVNRVIENFTYCRAIISGTHWENLFALRAHTDAQPEFRELSYKLLDAYNTSEPRSLKDGEWHIPFGDSFDENRLQECAKNTGLHMEELKKKISIARIARVSYYNFEGKDDYMADIGVCDKLFGSIPMHLSPTEHVCMNMNNDKFYGNLQGFKPYRKFLHNEHLSDPRVIKKHYKHD